MSRIFNNATFFDFLRFDDWVLMVARVNLLHARILLFGVGGLLCHLFV